MTILPNSNVWPKYSTKAFGYLDIDPKHNFLPNNNLQRNIFQLLETPSLPNPVLLKLGLPKWVLTRHLKDQAEHRGPQYSHRIRQQFRLSSRGQVSNHDILEPRAPREKSHTRGPKREFPNQSFQAKVPGRTFPSDGSQESVPKR